jgi:hypothetical protein
VAISGYDAAPRLRDPSLRLKNGWLVSAYGNNLMPKVLITNRRALHP